MRTTTHLLAGLCALLPLGAATASPILDVTATTPSVSVGSHVEVTVDVMTIADLYAYEFDVGFDPHVLRVDSVREGGLLAGVGATYFLPGAVNATTGRISGIADTLLTPVAGATGSGGLLTLDFTAIASGTSLVSLDGIELLDSAFDTIGVEATAASIRVTPAARVPEPLSISLLAPALLGLLRRRSGVAPV